MTELSGSSHYATTDGKTVPGSVGVILSNLECKVCGNTLDEREGKVERGRENWRTFSTCGGTLGLPFLGLDNM